MSSDERDLYERAMALAARPWDDPQMRFAMISVVMAALMWDKDPDERTEALLRQCLRLVDDRLRRWTEENPV